MSEAQQPTPPSEATTRKAVPNPTVSGGQGVQVGNGNIQINAFAIPIPQVEQIPLALPQNAGSLQSQACPLTRVPRNSIEEAVLLQTRPSGWEYMYYAASLLRRRQALAPKWRSHQMRYASRTGEWLDMLQAVRLLNLGYPEILEIIQDIMTSLSPAVQETAFGKPDEPGDPEAIDQIASFLVDSAEHMLDWSARLRGVAVPERLSRVFALAADLTTRPLEDIDVFIGDLVQAADLIPSTWHSDHTKSLDITLTLTLTVDKKLMKQFTRELRRASPGVTTCGQ
jgi:hypothetical protein